jgi:hypothetical protein
MLGLISCLRDIAQLTADAGRDYLLVVKGSQ